MGLSRREVLAGIGSVTLGSVAGCSSNDGESGTDTPKPSEKAYRYFFDDESRTLGETERVPEEAEEYQVIENTRSESDWSQMQLNDHRYARLAINDGLAPNHKTIEGSLPGAIQDIIDETRMLYNRSRNPEQTIDSTGRPTSFILDNQEVQNRDDAEIYTEAVRLATKHVTNRNTSPSADSLNPNLAEWMLENHMDFNIPGYKLSGTLVHKTPLDSSETGMAHVFGLLQYDKDNQTEVRYAEIENNSPEIMMPENSRYHIPLDEEIPRDPEMDSGNWVTPFDYEKRRNMEQSGKLEPDTGDGNTVVALVRMIDDAAFAPWNYPEDINSGSDIRKGKKGIDAVISDEFGESLEEYMLNPGQTYDREDIRDTARKVFSAAEKQKDLPYSEQKNIRFALTGTLDQPEILHPKKETVEEIREGMMYDEVRQQVEI